MSLAPLKQFTKGLLPAELFKNALHLPRVPTVDDVPPPQEWPFDQVRLMDGVCDVEGAPCPLSYALTDAFEEYDAMRTELEVAAKVA